MKFSDIIADIIKIENKEDFIVNKLCYNSQIVEKNDVFFALKGYKVDGNKYINVAINRGASAVFTDDAAYAAYNKIYKVNNCREVMALMANNFYEKPSLKMTMIGVTGTNGKTTTTSLIYHVLRSCGKKAGLIGTNGNIINGEKYETKYTTPESIELNELLNKMYNAGVQYVVMEVSSHSLSLKRVYGVDFDVVVFTNLTPEHLDFHKDMEDYFSAKKILFDSTQEKNKKGNLTYSIYNIDDAYGEKIVSSALSQKISYGFGKSQYRADNLNMDFSGMNFDVIIENGKKEKLQVNSRLIGKFNVYNILASTAVLYILNIPTRKIRESINSFEPVDGRFNPIFLNNGAVAVIDYSHTPDSLKKAIETILEINKDKGKIITVFGCGGDRDRTKRPLMGSIATSLSDLTVITSDNPRSENPLTIIEDIKIGIKNDNYFIEEDRQKAIEKAYNISNENDIILIAGKGHETYQEIKGVRYHLSDKEIISKFAA